MSVRVHLHASKLIVSKFIAYFLAAHLLRLLRFPGRAIAAFIVVVVV